MSADQPQLPRTYGGWRRRRGIGLWGLGPAGTFAVLAAALVLVLVAAVHSATLVYVTPPAAVAAGLGVARVGGESLAVRALRRLRWSLATARGYTAYQSTAAAGYGREPALPGVLAPLALVSAEDGYGGKYGLVWDRRTGLLTATLRVVPASTWLAERADADTWVANWGAWLASLGHHPMLKWVTVTVDTAPEPGSTLAGSVAHVIDPSAPFAARQILGQLVEAAPATAADVDTRVSLTFDPQASPAAPKNLAAAAAETGGVMYGLESALGTCGASVLGRLGPAEIAGVVRTAFNPAARAQTPRTTRRHSAGTGTQRIGWAGVGPMTAEELPSHYLHGSAMSVTWAWCEAPRQNVTAGVLACLLAPGPYPKRVALQYRPFPAAAATRVLEGEVNAAAFRAHYRHRTGRDETARDAHDQARARQAAAEEAAGAGVCLVSLYVTVTVASPGDLPRATAWVEAAADSSKVRLRRMDYSQAAGFAAALPCGICPAELSRRFPH
ncbi:MAG TPA: SCO6880 family protein [Streptosporangiaceae bacterium]|nr:SCO6880 family protein [Streptosporangiaceae bacterium]